MPIQNGLKQIWFPCVNLHIHIKGFLHDHQEDKQLLEDLQKYNCQDLIHSKQNLDCIVLETIEYHIHPNQLQF